MKNKRIMELAVYKLKVGIADGGFLQAAKQSQLAIQLYAGYEHRSLLYAADTNQWMDVAKWTSREDAMRAAEQFPQDSGTTDFMEYIDPATLFMNHYELAGELEWHREGYQDMAKCVEVIRYQLKEGYSLSAYVQAAAALGQVMQGAAACMGREAYYDTDRKEWLEVVYYTNRDSAQEWFESVGSTPVMQEPMSMVDEASVHLWFTEPRSLG